MMTNQDKQNTQKTTIKIPWKQKRPQKRYAIKLSIEY